MKAQETVLKNYLLERQLFLGRAVIAFAVITTLIIVLVSRLIYLQIVGHQYYAELSRSNQVQIEAVPPIRGLIYDRKGVLLANNVPTFVLEVVPEKIGKAVALNDLIAQLTPIFNLTEEDIAKFHRLRKSQASFAPIPLLLNLSDEAVARFAVNRHRFPGVEVSAQLVRHYPHQDLTSHVIGYVGRINQIELDQIDQANYRGSSHIGKLGIEKSYETALHGKTGFKEVETNARGRSLRVMKRHEPETGQDLYLTLDIELQRLAMEALGHYKGAVVAIDPTTGGILAMVSKPGYDPNLFVNGISPTDYNSLNQNPSKPLYDRALRGEYPPGSTIKPLVALAGLETGVTTHKHSVYCPGFYQLGGNSHRYRCWNKRGHGTVTMERAVAESCDVYFYSLAQSLKIDRFHDYLAQFGFGDKTGIDLLGERQGVMPSPRWKQQRFNKPWYPGETIIAGIGQGYVSVTPLQLAVAAATVATHGTRMKPRLVQTMAKAGHKEELIPQPPTVEMTLPKVADNNWQLVVQAMEEVTHGARGTARLVGKDAQYRMAGKTGTAQVFAIKQNETYKEHEVPEELRDHALFIAFAPAEQPKIAVGIVVENGGHGNTVAAPIARTLFDHYLLPPQPVTPPPEAPPQQDAST